MPESDSPTASVAAIESAIQQKRASTYRLVVPFLILLSLGYPIAMSASVVGESAQKGLFLGWFAALAFFIWKTYQQAPEGMPGVVLIRYKSANTDRNSRAISRLIAVSGVPFGLVVILLHDHARHSLFFLVSLAIGVALCAVWMFYIFRKSTSGYFAVVDGRAYVFARSGSPVESMPLKGSRLSEVDRFELNSETWFVYLLKNEESNASLQILVTLNYLDKLTTALRGEPLDEIPDMLK